MKSLLHSNSSRNLLTAAALLLPTTLGAQGQAPVRGVVKDISGARVPEATLLLKGLNGQEIAYSGADGAFVFPAIVAGNYTLSALSPGFARWQKDVSVGAAGADMDITLEMGRIQETVEVKGTRPKPAAPATTGKPQRIRVGGNVQPSRLVVRENPVYPQELQDQGVEGTVLLEAVISTSGTLLSLRPANGQVHPGLVKAAIDAVSRWRYQPTLLNGQPVEIITSITVRFRLAG